VTMPARRMPAKPKPIVGPPERMVIIGGGAAGFAAAEMLRREGFAGGVTIVSADDAPPCDRPNLSKDYRRPLRPRNGSRCARPNSMPRTRSTCASARRRPALDVAGRRVMLTDGEAIRFDKLLLATGAEPIRLQLSHARRDRGRSGPARRRRVARCRARRGRRRRAAAHRSRARSRPGDRPRCAGRRIPGNQRAGHFCRRRHCPLARHL
jgi:NADPH-dependent 2,4-dienoyl-CoA reductase/sulfur reductase-like enzyme